MLHAVAHSKIEFVMVNFTLYSFASCCMMAHNNRTLNAYNFAITRPIFIISTPLIFYLCLVFKIAHIFLLQPV